jgi:hypothetical protein
MMGDFPGRPIARLVYVPQVFTRVIRDSDGQTPIVIRETRIVEKTIRVPAASRTFKIGENESPLPRDRVFFQFNYFQDLWGTVNQRIAPVGEIHEYRQGFGFENTFLGGRASLGGRLPLSAYSIDSDVAGFGGTAYRVGDFAAVLKGAPYLDLANQRVFTLGVAITLPTAQGVPGPFDRVSIQPFAAWLWMFGDFFIQSFHGIAIPWDDDDVTFVFNDIGVGYFIYRSPIPTALLTGIAPTIEFHVNNPVNHRGVSDLTDPAGTPDWASFTVGATLWFLRRGTLAIGGNFPVTGPNPYDFEVLCQLNWFF